MTSPEMRLDTKSDLGNSMILPKLDNLQIRESEYSQPELGSAPSIVSLSSIALLFFNARRYLKS